MGDINNQLEKVVQENLNEVQMGVFRREMDRLQKIEVEFVQQREELKELTEKHDILSKEYKLRKEEITRILDREKDLEAREKEMAEQKTQLHIDNQLINLRKENADVRVQDHQQMVELIFRGPVFQKTVVESGSRGVVMPPPEIDQNGCTQYPTTNTVHDDNTITTTKEVK